MISRPAVTFSLPVRSSQPNPHSSPASFTLNPITDICTSVYQPSQADGALGFLADDQVNQRRHDVYLVDTAQTSLEIHTESLEKLLENARPSLTRRVLTRRDRLYIAVTLASSVLQLDRTMWLKRQWKSSDITFHYVEGCTSPLSQMNFSDPYLSWKVASQDLEPNNSAETSSLHLMRSEALFTLGLTLVELCFGRTLLSMQRPEEADLNETLARLNTARRLLDSHRIFIEMGEKYETVVRTAIFCTFNMPDVSLDNEECQRAVYAEIVTPLTETLENFDNTTGSVT